MKNMPRISDTEWEVMRVLWTRHPVTANDIIAQLAAQDPSWHPKTVRTLLNRLVRKRAIRFESEGREYAYSPLVGEDQSVSAASRSFLDRVFGGSLKPMLAHFVENQGLSREELEDLRQILKETPAAKNNESGRKSCKP